MCRIYGKLDDVTERNSWGAGKGEGGRVCVRKRKRCQSKGV